SLTSDRRAAIQTYLKETFEKDSLVYKDIAWGPSKTMKPSSYIQLDSLYAIKYKMEREGKRDTELEGNIQIQRQIALNDSTPILYLEDHLFSVTKNGQMTIYSAVLETNKDHEILNSEINASNNLDPKNLEEFKIFTFEESFLHPGYAPAVIEREFYERYKTKMAEFNGDSKDDFLNHTLEVMRNARTAGSLDPTAVLKQIIVNDAKKNLTNSPIGQTFESMEELITEVDGKTKIMGYQVVYSFKKIDNGLSTTFRYVYQVDTYYQVTLKSLL
ncbi:hypothetical protein N8079_03020, partial [Crocinitomicaceae bacterium]|nr:hypothetical protein [Crocinitomicaceae bacterium]